MEIPILDIHAYRQADVRLGGKIFSERDRALRTVKAQDRGVLTGNHFGGHFDFHGAAIARTGEEVPARRWPGVESGQVPGIEWGDKPIGHNPKPRALGEDVAIHRQMFIEIRAQQAIVFRSHVPEIDGQPRHATASVGEDAAGGSRMRYAFPHGVAFA